MPIGIFASASPGNGSLLAPFASLWPLISTRSKNREVSSGRLCRSLSICGFNSAAYHIAMRVHFVPENEQLVGGRDICNSERLPESERESRGRLHLFLANARMQAQRFHAFRFAVVPKDGKIG